MTRGGPGDAPLLAWGEALRAARLRRRTRLRLGRAAAAALLLLAAPILIAPVPRLIWNASESAPPGLYLLSPGGPYARGQIVVARLAEPWRSLAARRRYLPANVPLVKQVAASAGDEICAIGPRLYLEGRPLAVRLSRDGAGRALPWWEGCARLPKGRVLLLNPAPGSFDGRYFGTSDTSAILGRATLLWHR